MMTSEAGRNHRQNKFFFKKKKKEEKKNTHIHQDKETQRDD